ncbi:MAG: exo-alpha-sialidase [Planctomycetaceae bacterium]|nr:exo-alpha-sialidase [Planctomycetaceae bacterium]
MLRYGPVNDQIVDGLTPGGLVQTKSGDLITTFVDRGDAAAGSKSYLVRSQDQGKTWGRPFRIIEPASPREGLHTPIVQFPDGTLMLMINRISHVDSRRESVFNIRESRIELQISQDNGTSFQSIGFFTTPPQSLTAAMGALYQLQNGDLIIPAYCTPGSPRKHPGYQYGAGFFRSVDGGKHWGPLEVVFADPPTKDEVKQGFNEGAFVVREDGTLIAYARVDVHQGDEYKMNYLWMCQSRDQGITWTKPVETQIAGIYPSIKKLPSGQFVMLCGLRDSRVCRRTTSLFTSKDGINWKYRGHPYYSRTNGIPHNPATGGGQAMISMGDDTVYVVFYACDPKLPGYHKTYVDGGLLKL